MKNKILLFVILAFCLLSCGQPGVNANASEKAVTENTDIPQAIEITVDGKNYNITQDDIPTMSFVEQTHLLFGFLSEQNDIQFTLSAFLTELKPGTYQVYKCREPSSCTQEMDGKNQDALFAPYPKDPLPPVNLSRTAYDASDLGLKPVTLTITSVADEQQPGVPFKTKRLKGTYHGVLAYVEKQDTGWKIVGKPTNIEGKFDMFCTIR